MQGYYLSTNKQTRRHLNGNTNVEKNQVFCWLQDCGWGSINLVDIFGTESKVSWIFGWELSLRRQMWGKLIEKLLSWGKELLMILQFEWFCGGLLGYRMGFYSKMSLNFDGFWENLETYSSPC